MNNKPKMILLNAPKGAGKNQLLSFYTNYHSVGYNALMRGESNTHLWLDASCKVHLYKLVQDFFLVSEERFWEIYNDRELKEKPLPEFRVTLRTQELLQLEGLVGELGWDADIETDWEGTTINLSIRQAMIYLSEVIIKPRMGTDFFGRARLALIKQSPPASIYYDDSSSCFNGDCSELNGLVEHFGEDNILLIRIKGRGSFEGDSRSFIPDGVVKHTIDLWNDKDEDSFLEAGCNILDDFLNKE